MTDEQYLDAIRGSLSRLWAEDWNSEEDSVYDEFSRRVDRTLRDDALFERIRNEANAIPRFP